MGCGPTWQICAMLTAKTPPSSLGVGLKGHRSLGIGYIPCPPLVSRAIVTSPAAPKKKRRPNSFWRQRLYVLSSRCDLDSRFFFLTFFFFFWSQPGIFPASDFLLRSSSVLSRPGVCLDRLLQRRMLPQLAGRCPGVSLSPGAVARLNNGELASHPAQGAFCPRWTTEALPCLRCGQHSKPCAALSPCVVRLFFYLFLRPSLSL